MADLEARQRETRTGKSRALQRNVPALGAATRTVIIFIAVLTIPLAAAETLGLAEAQTTAWLLALYGLSGLVSLVLVFRYRQPLFFTGNLFVVIFISRLGTQFSYPELIGACMLAGAVVSLVAVLKLTKRLATWIPVPVVFGLLAGAVLSFVVDIFNQVANAPILVGGTFLAYVVSRRVLGRRVPPIFSALVVGLAIAGLTGQFGQVPTLSSLEFPRITFPAFSLSAIIAATPVFVVLIILQSNAPSLRFMQSNNYDPPDLVVNGVSGLGTMLGSFLGPTGISLSLPVTSLVASPQAGEHQMRHRAVYWGAGAALLIGLLAGLAATLPAVIPLPLLLALAGLALVDVLGTALKRITRGPLLLGPLFAFVIAFSEMSFLGFGSFFWALVLGTGVSLLLEYDELRQLREEGDESDESG